MILKYACCVFLICTTAFGASVWYASPTGRADAACTVDDPGTVQAAVNKVANGSASASDTVILKSGVYDYSDVIWSNKNCITVDTRWALRCNWTSVPRSGCDTADRQADFRS